VCGHPVYMCAGARGGQGRAEGEEGEALMAEALVEVRGGGGGAAVLGKLDAAHLADHPAAVAALRACVTVRRQRQAGTCCGDRLHALPGCGRLAGARAHRHGAPQSALRSVCSA